MNFLKHFVFWMLLTITTVKCLTNTSVSYTNITANVTKHPNDQINSTLDTGEPTTLTYSTQYLNSKNETSPPHIETTKKPYIARRILIVSQDDEFLPRRNFLKATRVTRASHTTHATNRRRRPIKRARSDEKDCEKEVAIAHKKKAEKAMKRNQKRDRKRRKVEVLVYNEFDDYGELINNVTMTSLEDVVKFFDVFLGVTLCYGQCDKRHINYLNSLKTSTVRVGKNMYYALNEYLPNGHTQVLESSTRWLGKD